MIDNNDYREGFIQGFRSIKGSSAAMPAVPARPATPAGKTPFQVGIIKGIEAAIGHKIG